LLATGHRGGPNRTGGPEFVKIWDLATNQLLWTLMGHCGVARKVVFSSSNSYLAAVAGEHIKLWRVADGKLEKIFGENF